MDPDLVREQAEAEREALALLRKKPAGAEPAVFVQRAIQADEALKTGAVPQEEAPAFTAAAALEAPFAVLPDAQPPEPAAGPPARRRGFSAAAQFGRFISFAVAGAMLGGGLGIAAANYMQLPEELAKLAIFGPAAFFATSCAIASFFTKASQD